MKTVYRITMILLFLTAGWFAAAAQETKIKKLVDSQTYVFIAQRANPTGGRAVELTGGYDLLITKNKIVAYLPYYGRAYSAPVSSDGGIKFTSTSFEYIITEGKKQSWNVTIKPRDVNTVRELNLNFYDNGTATLNVTSDQRQSISFDGYITEYKAPKVKGRVKEEIRK